MHSLYKKLIRASFVLFLLVTLKQIENCVKVSNKNLFIEEKYSIKII